MIQSALLLAAGRGKRLRPLTDSTPKALLPVGGRPIAQRVIDELVQGNVKKIVFIVGHLGDKIKSYFGSGSDCGVKYDYINQETLNGTAGAVKIAQQYVGDESFLVVFADSYFAPQSILHVIESPWANAIGVVSVRDPHRYGVVDLDGNSCVIDVVEKPDNPKSDLVIGGVYKFDRSVWHYISKLNVSPRGEFELPDVIKLMIADNYPIGAVRIPYMLDIGTIDQLQILNDTLINKGSYDYKE